MPVPATFVVGRDGLIKARHVDPDYRQRMEIDAVLAALKAAEGCHQLKSGSSAPSPWR